MLIRIRLKVVPHPAFAFLCPPSRLQCPNVEPFKFFRDYVGTEEEQIAAIRNGKAMRKVVESRTPDEVFVFGSVYVRSTPEQYLKACFGH